MRIRLLLASIACLAWAVVSAFAAAQQSATSGPPDLLVAPHFVPISVDEPRPFPSAGSLEARPLVPAYPQTPPAVDRHPTTQRRFQPPVDFRLVSVEEPVKPSARGPLRLAPRSEATRQPLTRPRAASPIATSPTSALGTVAGSLGVVLGLFLVIAWCSRRLSPAGTGLLPKEVVELLGRAPLTARQQMQLVRIGSKLLLVAVSPTGIETLTEVVEPSEVEHLTALCRRGQPSSSTVAFRQALNQLASEPTERGFVGSPRTPSRGAR
jgi:flagellar biogenesis protein FliO